MTEIKHHVPDWMMRDYVSGALDYPYGLVVATHVSLCDECRSKLHAHELVAGTVLEDVGSEPVSEKTRSAVLARLDDGDREIRRPAGFGVYPAPLAEALGGSEPRWRSLGLGVRQSILHDDEDGSVRLLFIPPEQAVPEHSHDGIELTLVLQGSFRDETDAFGVGDLEIADADLTHVPVSGPGTPCICLAATNAPLRFRSVVPRLTQRFFRI